MIGRVRGKRHSVSKNYGCLEPEGCGGAEAVEGARRSLPDLIVTDVLMPVPAAFKPCLSLETSPQTSNIPDIVVSGISPRILDLMPAAEYVVKPVAKRTLARAARKYI